MKRLSTLGLAVLALTNVHCEDTEGSDLTVIRGDLRVAATVGREGAELRLQDGTAVRIPRDALTSDTEIEVARVASDSIANPRPSGTLAELGEPITMKPYGTRLEGTLEVELPIMRSDEDASEIAVLLVEDEAPERNWEDLRDAATPLTVGEGQVSFKRPAGELAFGVYQAVRLPRASAEVPTCEGDTSQCLSCGTDMGAVAIECQCDGVAHCPGAEPRDEMSCPANICDGSTSYFPEQICNGIPDCEDRKDERNCRDWFVCADASQVIERAKVCDGTVDCTGDQSDEGDCPTDALPFLCANRTSVTAAQLCDGTNDCPGGEDEATTVCFPCDGENIFAARRCDGTQECTDGLDEKGCSGVVRSLCTAPSQGGG